MLLSCLFIAKSPEPQNALKHLIAAHLPSDIIVGCLDSVFLLVRKDFEAGHLALQSLAAACSSAHVFLTSVEKGQLVSCRISIFCNAISVPAFK